MVKWPRVTLSVAAAKRASQLPFARTTLTPEGRSRNSGHESSETSPVFGNQSGSSECLQWPGPLKSLRQRWSKMGRMFKSATHWPRSCTEMSVSRKYASTPRVPRLPVSIGRVQPVKDRWREVLAKQSCCFPSKSSWLMTFQLSTSEARIFGDSGGTIIAIPALPRFPRIRLITLLGLSRGSQSREEAM